MTGKQHRMREERPPSLLLLPPRNPFAHAAKMRRGVEIHEKSRGALRRGLHMKLTQAIKGDLSVFEN
ncbi:MAG: hypothetical protein LBI68_08280 [Azoarcus sp.]|nr:hypothetical protein [Azoarcus sp.]